MSKRLYLSQLEKKYKISYVHNPKHFNLNSLYIENHGDRKVLCARARKHSKPFHIVAILTPLVKKKFPISDRELLQKAGERKEPFMGIFRD